MKTSKIHFDFYRNPSPIQSNADATYHVRINQNQTIDLTHISEVLQRSTTVTQTDIAAVMMGMKEIIAEELSKGNVVNLNGICRVEPILGLNNKKCTGTEHGSQLELKRLRMRPAKNLVQKVKADLAPCQRNRAHHSEKAPTEEIARKLAAYFQSTPYITRKILQDKFGLTRYRAYQVLNQLKEEGKLVHPGHSHAAMYLPTPSIMSVQEKS